MKGDSSIGSGSAKRSGLAFEWAVATSARELLLEVGQTSSAEIVLDGRARTAESAFESFRQVSQNQRIEAATAGVRHVIEREADFVQRSKDFSIALQSDAAGQRGDVRDLVISDGTGRSIGISCKNNHHDFKHPRLSDKADFVKRWKLGAGCSREYWTTVGPIFGKLKEIREDSGGSATFDADVPNLNQDFIWPILNEFELEIRRLIQVSGGAPHNPCEALVRYIIGSADFYKVINNTSISAVEVQAFNFNGTLHGKRSILPSKLLDVEDLKPGNDLVERNDPTKIFTFDRGYSFFFRLHSADKNVKPSLKFGIGAIGLPQSEIHTHHISLP